jgi:PAS domain S-box-containing protein
MSTVSLDGARADQSRLDFAAAVADAGIWEWDIDNDRLRVDRGSTETYAVDVTVHRDVVAVFDRIIHPHDRTIFREAVDALSFRPRHLQIQLRARSGVFRRVDVTLKPGSLQADRVSPVVIIVRRIAFEVEAAHNTALLQRVCSAIQAADVTCWEFSYLEDRFTWLDSMPEGIHADPDELELANRLLAESILPEDNIAIRTATQNALADGANSLSSVMRRRDSAGNVRHFKLHQSFFRDESGRPLRAIGATRDITAEVVATEQLRQQTEVLRETQKRLDRASASIQEGHWELQLASHEHWASNSYLSLLGYTEETGHLDTLEKVQALIHPDDMDAVKTATQDHLNGGPPYTTELRMRTRDGAYRWFRVRGCSECDATGRAVIVSGSIQDIQKQRSAEDALQEVQARFARAINGTQHGLWEMDLDRHKAWLSPRPPSRRPVPGRRGRAGVGSARNRHRSGGAFSFEKRGLSVVPDARHAAHPLFAEMPGLRLHAGHHRIPRGARRTHSGHRSRRGRQPRQERFSGQCKS